MMVNMLGYILTASNTSQLRKCWLKETAKLRGLWNVSTTTGTTWIHLALGHVEETPVKLVKRS